MCVCVLVRTTCNLRRRVCACVCVFALCVCVCVCVCVCPVSVRASRRRKMLDVYFPPIFIVQVTKSELQNFKQTEGEGDGSLTQGDLQVLRVR